MVDRKDADRYVHKIYGGYRKTTSGAFREKKMKKRWMWPLMQSGLYCLLVLGLLLPPLCPAAEPEKTLSREERAAVDYVLVLDTKAEIEAMFCRPVALLEEKLLTTIEETQNISIKRSSMVKTELCLLEILSDIPHLSKISTGSVITRAEIHLRSGTSRATIWSDWRSRKLESPILTITFYYGDGRVAPAEISCTGHKYH